MLAMALLMTVSAIIVGFLASKVSASIGKELREKYLIKYWNFLMQKLISSLQHH